MKLPIDGDKKRLREFIENMDVAFELEQPSKQDILLKFVKTKIRFGLTDRLEVYMDHVRMPAGNGRAKTKERSLDVLSDINKSIVVKVAILRLAHALIKRIAMARVNGDPKHKSCKDGKC
jgi:hypothetical protein